MDDLGFLINRLYSTSRKRISQANKNAEGSQIKTGTVILGTSAIDGEGRRVGVSATDMMMSNGFGPETYDYRKVYFINPFVQMLITGYCTFIDEIASLSNFFSRYVQAYNSFEKGIDNPQSMPKMNEVTKWVSDFQKDCLGFNVFILNGQYDDGSIDLAEVDESGLVLHMKTDMEQQRIGSESDWPMKWPTSGCGQGESYPVLNYCFSLVNNRYNAIPVKSVSVSAAKAAAVLSVISAFNTQPHATGFVGGNVVLSVMKHGDSLSPDTHYVELDGQKVLSLKALQPFIQERFTRGIDDDLGKLIQIKASDGEIDELIEEKINETIMVFGDLRHDFDIKRTQLQVGSYNPSMYISRWKRPDEIRLNDETTDEAINRMKELFGPFRIKPLEFDESSHPETELGMMTMRLDEAINKSNNMIIVYKSRCRADKDEVSIHKKDSFDGVVFLRYLSSDELKFSEHVCAWELEDMTKIGWSGIGSDGGVISRQLERNLFTSLLYTSQEIDSSSIETLVTQSYDDWIKHLFSVEEARVNSMYGVKGFNGVGASVGESIDIVKMTEMGAWAKEKIKVVGPSNNWFIAEDFLNDLPDEAFSEDICYYSGVLALFHALRETNPNKGKRGYKKRILEGLRDRLEIVHLSRERSTFNSKLSVGKINQIIDNIIIHKLYR